MGPAPPPPGGHNFPPTEPVDHFRDNRAQAKLFHLCVVNELLNRFVTCTIVQAAAAGAPQVVFITLGVGGCRTAMQAVAHRSLSQGGLGGPRQVETEVFARCKFKV